jgi:hypothetical protein
MENVQRFHVVTEPERNKVPSVVNWTGNVIKLMLCTLS